MNGIKKVLACLTVMLLLISAVPISVSASEDRGKGIDNKKPGEFNNRYLNQSKEEKVEEKQEKREEKIEERQEKLEEKFERRQEKREEKQERIEEKIEQRKEKLEHARNNYAEMKMNFHEINEKVNNNEIKPNSDVVVNITKNYLNSTLDYMIEHIEYKKSNLNATNVNFTETNLEDLNESLNQLKQKRTELKSTETMDEISDLANDIREIWRETQNNSNSLAIKVVNERINNFLEKSEAISLRIENEIEQLKSQGKNVEDMEELLEEYQNKIDNVKEHQETAKEIYDNASDDKSIVDAKIQLRKAIGELKEANQILKELFNEIKGQRNNSVKLNGTETLNASGDGPVVFSGNLTINISTTDAKLVVKDHDGDADINITGNYSKVNENENKPEGLSDNRALVYHGLVGDVNISGSSLTVMVNGENVTLNAKGIGSVHFSDIERFDINNENEYLTRSTNESTNNTSMGSNNTSLQINNTNTSIGSNNTILQLNNTNNTNTSTSTNSSGIE